LQKIRIETLLKRFRGAAMQKGKKIQDIMVGIFDYPHIPYWFSISQAIKIIRVSFMDSKKSPDPMAVLVFDEKYNLMGTWFFSAGQVIEKIKNSVDNFRGNLKPVDDLTILNIKYTPDKKN